MPTKEQFLSLRQRYRPIALPQEFSGEEMARDWTLSESGCVTPHRQLPQQPARPAVISDDPGA
jgi:hypothetical protein